MSFVKNDILFIQIDGDLVVGEITWREKYYIEVRIVKPYCNWHSSLARSGMAKMAPDHYLTEHGDKVARTMLAEMYYKIKKLDHNLPRLAKIYQKLQMNLKVIDDFIPKGIYEENAKSIKSNLCDWFYGSLIFTSTVSGINVALDEREIIENVFQNYIKNKRKIYLQVLDN